MKLSVWRQVVDSSGAQVVYDEHSMAGLESRLGDVTPDEPRSSGD
jgi:hypothetical protein